MRAALLLTFVATPVLAQPIITVPDNSGLLAQIQAELRATKAEEAALEKQITVMEAAPPPPMPATLPPEVQPAPVVVKGNSPQASTMEGIPGDQAVLRSSDFLNTIGLNTHMDFGTWSNFGYENVQNVINSINYLGLKNLRDSAQPGTTWQQVAQATGARFNAFINEESPDNMVSDLGNISERARQGILNFIEGGNEEDDPYPAGLGNNLSITAQFQQRVHALGRSLGLPVINMSFGAGWSAANNWQGDYDKVGDLSQFSDYANAHTYANPGQTTASVMQRLNGLAHIAAKQRPVITTEIGWDEAQGFSQGDVAKFAVQATLDGIKAHNVKVYFYALFDDGSGRFGLMHKDSSPKPVGTAIHNLTTILADPTVSASSFKVTGLGFSLAGASENDNSLVMQKSDGSHWLALWNENDGPHRVTINGVGSAQVFDPLSGTTPVSFDPMVTVSDRPVLVQLR